MVFLQNLIMNIGDMMQSFMGNAPKKFPQRKKKWGDLLSNILQTTQKKSMDKCTYDNIRKRDQHDFDTMRYHSHFLTCNCLPKMANLKLKMVLNVKGVTTTSVIQKKNVLCILLRSRVNTFKRVIYNISTKQTEKLAKNK
ncbi:hypothetical protein AK88_03141 [Plasmodium fragile]|uniref:Uncharacterized protein n=1 Tax=Plasmodium fragile TaxID=5857 RepID=A0A0D9QJN7_PLAFR|nr:uncharacterized protein AK88_03141 [Plasmodium fragile]KJP87224.1 hypothetical protein AK88_03141 [Plasmodium fragile]